MSSEPAQSNSLTVEILKLMVPALIVAVGWFVVSRQNDHRERRKEIRSLIDDLKDIILEVKNSVETYYSSPDSESVGRLSASIKLNLLLVSQYLFVLREAGLGIDATSELIALRKTATGNHFESAAFRKQLNDPYWFTNLNSQVAELILLLEKRYFTQFRLRTWKEAIFGVKKKRSY